MGNVGYILNFMNIMAQIPRVISFGEFYGCVLCGHIVFCLFLGAFLGGFLRERKEGNVRYFKNPVHVHDTESQLSTA